MILDIQNLFYQRTKKSSEHLRTNNVDFFLTSTVQIYFFSTFIIINIIHWQKNLYSNIYQFKSKIKKIILVTLIFSAHLIAYSLSHCPSMNLKDFIKDTQLNKLKSKTVVDLEDPTLKFDRPNEELKKVCNIAINNVKPGIDAINLFEILKFKLNENVIDVRITQDKKSKAGLGSDSITMLA